MAVSPDSSTVYVTGSIGISPSNPTDYGTVAYDATTGARKWIATYNGGDSCPGGPPS